MSDANPYETPQTFAVTPEQVHPLRRAGRGAVFLLRSLVAASLGAQMAGFLCLAINLRGWTGVLVSAGALLAVVFARKHLLLLFAAMVITYFAGMAYSRHRISEFCNSFTIGTPSADLPGLAEQANVDFRISPPGSGPSYSAARDPFSMGDFGCRVSFDTQGVLSKRLGF